MLMLQSKPLDYEGNPWILVRDQKASTTKYSDEEIPASNAGKILLKETQKVFGHLACHKSKRGRWNASCFIDEYFKA